MLSHCVRRAVRAPCKERTFEKKGLSMSKNGKEAFGIAETATFRMSDHQVESKIGNYGKFSMPEHLSTMPLTRVSTLGNSMRVASETVPRETISLGVWLDAGSVSETESTNGVAHFLEHMAFKGTDKFSGEEIESLAENKSIQLNAYTSREQTAFYGQCLKKDAPLLVELLSEIVLKPTIQPELLERERAVILDEKSVTEENVQNVLFDYIHASAYQGHPLGRTILGPSKNIESLQRSDLVDYVEQNYLPNRMVLCSIGNIEHAEVVDLANKHFGHREASNTPSPVQLSADGKSVIPPYTGSEIRHRDDTMDVAHVAVAMEAVGWSHPDFYVFQVLKNLLGEYHHSQSLGTNYSWRLAETVSTENLCYGYNTSFASFNDTGLFSLNFSGKMETTDDMLFESLNEMVRLSRNALPGEVELAKRHALASYLVPQPGTEQLDSLGREMLALGRKMPIAEVYERINAITPADVKRVAETYLTDVDLCAAAIGPIDNTPDYNQLRSWTCWKYL